MASKAGPKGTPTFPLATDYGAPSSTGYAPTFYGPGGGAPDFSEGGGGFGGGGDPGGTYPSFPGSYAWPSSGGGGGAATPNKSSAISPTTYNVKDTGQWVAGSPLVPGLTQNLADYLQSIVGRGATPFEGATTLPSTGDPTAPGQLSAGITPELWKLMQYYTGAATDPSQWVQPVGGDILGEMAKTGMPVSTSAEWAKMQSAMERQYRQGAANVAEGFAVGGGMAGSPYGQASTDYELQAAKDKASLLGSMETKSLESARGRQVQALDILKSYYGLNQQQQQFMLTQAGKLAELFQGYDQAAIDRTLAEFIRTQPEYGPLLNMIYGLATTFPPYLGKTTGLGAVGGILAGAGSVAQAGVSAYEAWKKAHPSTTTGGGVGGCWILTALYGKDNWRTKLLWTWMTNSQYGWATRSLIGRLFVKMYYAIGESVAKAVKKDRVVEFVSRKFFDWMLRRVLKEGEYA